MRKRLQDNGLIRIRPSPSRAMRLQHPISIPMTQMYCVKDDAKDRQIEILVDGIDNSELLDAIEGGVRDSLRHLPVQGGWAVSVTPSRIAGRWDLHVRGRGQQHLLLITAPAPVLPALIPQRLRRSLHQAGSLLVGRTGGWRRARRSDEAEPGAPASTVRRAGGAI
jgi:hypothetical protein